MGEVVIGRRRLPAAPRHGSETGQTGCRGGMGRRSSVVPDMAPHPFCLGPPGLAAGDAEAARHPVARRWRTHRPGPSRAPMVGRFPPRLVGPRERARVDDQDGDTLVRGRLRRSVRGRCVDDGRSVVVPRPPLPTASGSSSVVGNPSAPGRAVARREGELLDARAAGLAAGPPREPRRRGRARRPERAADVRSGARESTFDPGSRRRQRRWCSGGPGCSSTAPRLRCPRRTSSATGSGRPSVLWAPWSPDGSAGP